MEACHLVWVVCQAWAAELKDNLVLPSRDPLPQRVPLWKTLPISAGEEVVKEDDGSY